MNVLLFSMPDSFEHNNTPSFAMRFPNGALASLAGNFNGSERPHCRWRLRSVWRDWERHSSAAARS